MPIRTIFLGLGAAAALVHVASYIMIMADLDRRGYKPSIKDFLLALGVKSPAANSESTLPLTERAHPGR